MTTEVELLPLPAEDYVDDEGLWEKRYGPYSPDQMKDYARANVLHHTATLQAEINALREALAELVSWIPSADVYRRMGFDPEAPMRAFERARALLRRELGDG